MAINWKRKRYTQEELRIAVSQNASWRGVAKQVGLNPDAGGIYYSLKAAVSSLDLDISHFTGQGWNTGNTKLDLSKYTRIDIKDILVENSTYLGTSTLKKRLVKEGMLEWRCYAPHCPHPNESVNGFTGETEIIRLSLDHINGVRTDNRLENLRLLCYHCHAQTPTWCTKNWKTSRARRQTEKSEGLGPSSRDNDLDVSSNLTVPTVCDCGNSMTKGSKQCQACEYKSRKGKLKPQTSKINWPSDEELIQRLAASNFLALSRELGVSDNAIRKHMKRRGLLDR